MIVVKREGARVYIFTHIHTYITYLVHKDDAGLVLARVAKHLADDARGLADVLVDDGGGQHLLLLDGLMVG